MDMRARGDPVAGLLTSDDSYTNQRTPTAKRGLHMSPFTKKPPGNPRTTPDRTVGSTLRSSTRCLTAHSPFHQRARNRSQMLRMYAARSRDSIR